MSRFRRKDGPRRKPASDLGNQKRMGRRLTALLGVLGLITGLSLVFMASSAMAAGDGLTHDTSCGHVVFTNANSFEVNVQYDADNAPGGSFEESANVPANGSKDIATSLATFRYYAYGSDGNGTVVEQDDSITMPTDCSPPDNQSVTPTEPAVTTAASCDNDGVMTVTPDSQSGAIVWDPSGATAIQPGDSQTFSASPADGYEFPDNAQASWTKTNNFDTSQCDNGGGNPVPGDNGDVKTHNTGTSTGDVSDEPKVSCSGFYLDGFNFDGLQAISWWITEGTHGDTVLSGTISLDENGHGYTDTLNLPNGQYKLYWTWEGKNGDPKHKVFKVEGDCEVQPPGDTVVTPTKPTATQPSCDTTLKMTVTPDSQSGAIVWDPSGATVLNEGAGGVPGDSVTYTATPAKGFTFPDGDWSWTFVNDFDTVSCVTNGPPPVVNPPVVLPPLTSECASSKTWVDANHNGVVELDKGECVVTAVAETGLSPLTTAAYPQPPVDRAVAVRALVPGVLLIMLGGLLIWSSQRRRLNE